MDSTILFAICLYSGFFVAFLVSMTMIFSGRSLLSSILASIGIGIASMVIFFLLNS